MYETLCLNEHYDKPLTNDKILYKNSSKTLIKNKFSKYLLYGIEEIKLVIFKFMRKIKKFLKGFVIVRTIFELKNNYLKKKGILMLQKKGSLLNMLSQKQNVLWKRRIKLVMESADNNKIHYVSNAGKFNEDNNLVMHNGIIIDPISYYGLPALEMLFRNKGVHEPQEEYAFQEVLKEIPDSGVMIELGAYWSFYSMWFNSKIKNAKNYMIEPKNIYFGIKNFNLNKMKGDFTEAFISERSVKTNDNNEIPTICVDDFVEEKKIEFVDILHSDIQGHEFLMLLGAEKTLDKKSVGYVFVSTHSQELHYKCLDYLKSKGYILVCSADKHESYSVDGLLIFKNPNYSGLESIVISKRG